jgi:hypothetical protein
VISVQFSKAEFPIAVAGDKSISCKLEQFAKAEFPIVLIPGGQSKKFKFTHWLKASTPIVAAEHSTLVNPTHPAKAHSSTMLASIVIFPQAIPPYVPQTAVIVVESFIFLIKPSVGVPINSNTLFSELTLTVLIGQEVKQKLPIEVTEFKLTSVKFLQSANACSETVVALLKLTDVRPIEPANANKPTVVIVDGMVIFPQATPPPYVPHAGVNVVPESSLIFCTNPLCESVPTHLYTEFVGLTVTEVNGQLLKV